LAEIVSSSQTENPSAARARTALGVASFLAFGALLVLYGANSSQLIEALELDYADLGLVGSMLSLGLGGGIVLAGPIVDRFPRRPLYVGACAIVLAAATTLGPNTTYDTLLLHTIAIGFGAGFYETVLNALIVEEHGTNAPRRLLFIHAAATAAASATPLLISFARDFAPVTWYEAFRIAGLAHIALIIGAYFVPMRSAPRHDRAAPDTALPPRPLLPHTHY
jgi:putative MFS transporter